MEKFQQRQKTNEQLEKQTALLRRETERKEAERKKDKRRKDKRGRTEAPQRGTETLLIPTGPKAKEGISGPCVACDMVISFKTSACPHCGHPLAGEEAKEGEEGQHILPPPLIASVSFPLYKRRHRHRFLLTPPPPLRTHPSPVSFPLRIYNQIVT